MLQSKALAIMKSGRNIFLTGSAGAGKTYVLNQYIQYLKERKISVAVTASTGIAATHMNGQTIHSWAGIGIKDSLSERYLVGLKARKYFTKKMDAVQVLVIDEISMLHRNQLDLVNRVLKYFKQNQLPFGGIQVIFSGDFFQLPPIGNEMESSREKFAFMSDAWLETNPVICYLTEQHRQTQNALNDILNEIREGRVSEESISLLQTRLEVHPEEGGSETRLYTHNADVDKINLYYLEQIGSPSRTFKASFKGNPALIEVLKNSVLALEDLKLKTGARVMFVRNNYESGFVNGTMGTVISFTEKGFPLVRTFDNELIETKTETWAIEDESGKALASFTQIPLRLAWAITVHKSQGMTLDSAVIDLSRAFERGQGYVGISRLRDLEGLKLRGLNQTALEVDELAMRADSRFRELSEEWDQMLDEKTLMNESVNFIFRCGGILETNKIAKQKEKLAYKNQSEKPKSFELTKKYVLKKLSLDEIAEKRGVKRNTIIQHLSQIAEADEQIDLEIYRPSNALLKKVKKAVQNLSGKDKSSLGKLFVELNGEFKYEEIRLALIFINRK